MVPCHPVVRGGGTKTPDMNGLKYAASAVRTIVSSPAQGSERVMEKLAARRDRKAAVHYETEPCWEERLHELLGEPWPCRERPAFEELWTAILRRLAQRGLQVGKGAFGGWDDADPALARAVWCLTCHLGPRTVVETGVARGLTTRVVLEVLERAGAGRLWSIDLPPLLEAELREETAAAVPMDGRGRWTLFEGSSRRLLPGLLEKLGRVDLFIHDSMHTERNLRFELDRVWEHLAPGGVLVADDVSANPGLRSFTKSHRPVHSLVCKHDDDGTQFAILFAPGAG